jgi:hypothetical protein
MLTVRSGMVAMRHARFVADAAHAENVAATVLKPNPINERHCKT